MREEGEVLLPLLTLHHLHDLNQAHPLLHGGHLQSTPPLPPPPPAPPQPPPSLSSSDGLLIPFLLNLAAGWLVTTIANIINDSNRKLREAPLKLAHFFLWGGGVFTLSTMVWGTYVPLKW